MNSDGWIEHRRQDGELVGWIRPEGGGFVPVDRLGRDRSAATDWLEAERVLDGLGLEYLADAFELRRDDGSWQRVRIVEASSSRVRVKEEDFGAVGGPLIEYTVPFPVTGVLRPHGRTSGA